MDRRRIVPVDGTFPINTETTKPTATKPNDEIKKVFIKTGLINNAHGSSYMEIDDNIIEASVFGPRPIRGSFINQASVSVECRFLLHVPQPNDKIFQASDNLNPNGTVKVKYGLTPTEHKISSYVETAILPSILQEKYPKSTIDLHITIIENHTLLLNLINWVINCCSLALVDAGIELKDIVTSGQINVKTENGQQVLVVDPNENDNSVEVLVSFMNLVNDEIVGLWIEGDGALQGDKVGDLIQECNKMSRKVRANINGFLMGSI